MTLKQMAQSALDVQSACNLSGVVGSFRTIVESMRIEHGMDTPTCNRHPVCRLFIEQMAFLNGHTVSDLSGPSYGDAYRECERIVRAPEDIIVTGPDIRD